MRLCGERRTRNERGVAIQQTGADGREVHCLSEMAQWRWREQPRKRDEKTRTNKTMPTKAKWAMAKGEKTKSENGNGGEGEMPWDRVRRKQREKRKTRFCLGFPRSFVFCSNGWPKCLSAIRTTRPAQLVTDMQHASSLSCPVLSCPVLSCEGWGVCYLVMPAIHLALECLLFPCMYLCPVHTVCRCGSLLGWLVGLSVCLPSWLLCMCALDGCVLCSCVVYVGVCECVGVRVLSVCFSVSVFVCLLHPPLVLSFYFLRSFPPVSFSCHLQAGLNRKNNYFVAVG